MVHLFFFSFTFLYDLLLVFRFLFRFVGPKKDIWFGFLTGQHCLIVTKKEQEKAAPTFYSNYSANTQTKIKSGYSVLIHNDFWHNMKFFNSEYGVLQSYKPFQYLLEAYALIRSYSVWPLSLNPLQHVIDRSKNRSVWIMKWAIV